MRVGRLKRAFIVGLKVYALIIIGLLAVGYVLGEFSDKGHPVLAKDTFYAILTIVYITIALSAMVAFAFIGRASDREFLRNSENQENFNFQDAFMLPDERMHGYKLARIVGRVPTFMGLTGDLYTSDASAHCGVNPDHVPPVKGCQCGFHAFKELREASREQSSHRTAFLFDVDLYGLGFIYQRGFRAETQVINQMILPKRCMLCKIFPAKRFIVKYEFSNSLGGYWEWQIRCHLCSSATKAEDRLAIEDMAQKLGIEIITLITGREISRG